MREVPVLDVAHPLVDEVGVASDGTRWLVTESRAPVIFLTPATGIAGVAELRGLGG